MRRRAKIIKRIKPELPGGFRDYAPADAIMRQRLIEKIRKTFEAFGFDPMETPAIERTEVLVGGEKESQKIIFNIKGSRDKKSDASLRFDLTVPLARFYTANQEIPRPLKRYQIGQAWRGESPQAGRYREFMQADIDIIGVSSMEADSEIVTLIYSVFKNLGMNRFLIKINNRKILNGLPVYAGFPEKKLEDVLRAIDKKDKIGEVRVVKELAKTIRKAATEKVIEFLKTSGDTKEKLLRAREIFKESETAREGIQELTDIAKYLNAFGLDQKNWEIDFSIVRGLGYYTGPVFETILTARPELGSMFSGGRYDNLMLPFTGQKIPAVGASLGVDRLYAALNTLGILKKKATVTKVLILSIVPEFMSDYLSCAKNLRGANINTAVYCGDDKTFQAQLAYAVKKEIPYILIYGEEEKKKGVVKIKNLATREQKEIRLADVIAYFNTAA